MQETISNMSTSEELRSKIETAAEDRLRPDQTPYRALLFKEERQLVQETGCSHREVQLAALKMEIVPERYARNQKSLSYEDQIRMLNSHAVIIGQGGLGGTVTEILARIGIGKLTLVDGDHFEDSNLNRQLLSSTDALGQMKAEVGAKRVHSINPAVETRCITQFFTKENGEEIIGEAGIAVDCLDTISARFVLEKVCRDKQIPLVSAAIGGASGQATVIFPEDPGLRLVYGSPDKAPQRGGEATLGTLPYAAVAMAAFECAEVVGLAINRPSHLRKKLLVADFYYHSTETIILAE